MAGDWPFGALIREARELAAELDDLEDRGGDDPDLWEQSSFVLDELDHGLNECAPPLLWFGMNPGDGSSFGWWPRMEEIEELPRFEDTDAAAEEEIIGEFITVNDRGNIEVYCRHEDGNIESLFGLV